jgi:hypothetical protein
MDLEKAEFLNQIIKNPAEKDSLNHTKLGI